MDEDSLFGSPELILPPKLEGGLFGNCPGPVIFGLPNGDCGLEYPPIDCVPTGVLAFVSGRDVEGSEKLEVMGGPFS